MRLKTLTAGILAAIAATSCTTSPSTQMDNSSNSDQALRAIMTRSSVREYTDAPVSADTVDILLRAAMAAPSAMNKQPWHFVVVTNRAKLTQLGDSLPNAKRMLDQAPVAIVVCGNPDRFIEGEGREYWTQDCSAATENLLVAANAMGLGAVWCGIYPIAARVQAAREVLGMSQNNLIPMCVIPVGHPAGEPTVKDKWDETKIVRFQ